MIDFFLKRLTHDLDACRSSGRTPSIHRLLARWPADPQWCARLRQLPLPEQRRMLADLGLWAFEHDAGGYASTLRENARLLDGVWNDLDQEDVLRKHTTQQLMSDGDSSGDSHWSQARAAGRGIIAISARQAHPGFAIYDQAQEDLEFLGIWHDDPAHPQEKATLVCGVGRRMKLLDTTPASVRPILSALSRRGCLMLYNDFAYPSSTGIVTSLFGQPVPISRSAVRIALKTKATVLPITAARTWPPETGRVRRETFAPLPLDDLDRHRPEDVRRAALRMGIATECLIRRNPAQWVYWDTLIYRARAGHRQLCAAHGSHSYNRNLLTGNRLAAKWVPRGKRLSIWTAAIRPMSSEEAVNRFRCFPIAIN